MNLAVIGPGNVGRALAGLALGAGHPVIAGVRDPGGPRAEELRAALPGVDVQDVAGAARASAVILLTTPYAAARDALLACGDLGGRIVVDCTNPVGPGFTHAGGHRAGAQILADAVPSARMVKAFNVYGVENLGAPITGPSGLRGMMPVAGDDAEARRSVLDLATDMGWDGLDVGPLAQALHLEHLALLWIRMVRGGGHDPRFVWACLRDG